MKEILFNSLFFLALALVLFIFDYVFIMKKKLKSKKVSNDQIMEINYLISKFKLDKNKVLYKPMCLYCSLINGFIISFTVTIISNIKLNMIWQLLIGFAIVFALIYAVYEIYGKVLIRKGWQKKDV